MTDINNSKLSINPETCTGCGLCVLACPVDVIRMDAVSAKPIIAYPRDCQVCYLCEDDCPTQSISLSHDISNSRRVIRAHRASVLPNRAFVFVGAFIPRIEYTLDLQSGASFLAR